MNKRYGIVVAALAAGWLAGCATEEGGSGMSRDAGTNSAAPSETRSMTSSPASGTSGDSLQACMSRIPSGASAGQRMMAEQSCQRDEAARKSIMAVPGAK
jgi:hypothetical protein